MFDHIEVFHIGSDADVELSKSAQQHEQLVLSSMAELEAQLQRLTSRLDELREHIHDAFAESDAHKEGG